MFGAGRGRDGELVFSEDRVSVWEDDRVLEMDGDGNRAMRRPIHLKMTEMVYFCYVYFTTIKTHK